MTDAEKKATEHATREKILRLRAEGLTWDQIADRLGMSRSVVHRLGGGAKRGNV